MATNTPHGDCKNTMGRLFAPSFHRPWLRYIEPVEGAEGGDEKPAEGADDDKTDWKTESRKWEARAKENAAKAKVNDGAAQRLKEIEDADKSEAEKATARAEAAEKRAADAEAKALRADVATEKKVPASLLTGSTREELEKSADELVAFRGEGKKPEPDKQDKKTYFIPDEGGKPDLGKTETTRPGIGTLRAAYESISEGK
jgi:hypothetical protein